VLFTVGAIIGGGLFGDHASPVSDTTVLSSFGAGSDHMDHVTTQLPYALTVAAISMAVLVVMGLVLAPASALQPHEAMAGAAAAASTCGASSQARAMRPAIVEASSGVICNPVGSCMRV
jgi:Na+/H+ antiporter NhaC